MNRAAVALSIVLAAVIGALVYLHAESRRMEAEILRLNENAERMLADGAQFRQQMQAIEAALVNTKASTVASGALCDRAFPSALYQLQTSTDYGANTVGEFEIYHASVALAEWNVNVGTTLNSYGIPTDLYFDYDGDGRIDTALAARLVREIPVAGKHGIDLHERCSALR